MVSSTLLHGWFLRFILALSIKKAEDLVAQWDISVSHKSRVWAKISSPISQVYSPSCLGGYDCCTNRNMPYPYLTIRTINRLENETLCTEFCWIRLETQLICCRDQQNSRSIPSSRETAQCSPKGLPLVAKSLIFWNYNMRSRTDVRKSKKSCSQTCLHLGSYVDGNRWSYDFGRLFNGYLGRRRTGEGLFRVRTFQVSLEIEPADKRVSLRRWSCAIPLVAVDEASDNPDK